jgi:hypothetical protein
MTLRKFGIITLSLSAFLFLSTCISAPDPSEKEHPEVKPAPFIRREVVDGLSAATLAKTAPGVLTYVKAEGGSYALKTLEMDAPDGPAPSVEVGDNLTVISAGPGGLAALTAGEGSPRKINLYPDAPGPVKTFEYPGLPLHHAEAAFALSGPYIIAGWEDEADKTYIGLYAVAGGPAPTHTPTEAVLGELISLSIQDTFILAGGTGGTAVYRINPADLSLTLVSPPDNQESHWMKNNGAYVLESKADGTVKVWKWNGPSRPPEAAGSIPAIEAGTPIRALQFDPADSATAYMVSFTGGQVYRLDLAELRSRALFTYPKHLKDNTSYDFIAWMIEKAAGREGDYYVITGGYGDRANPRGASGVALVFKAPAPAPEGGLFEAIGAPLSVEYYTGLVRSLRVLRNSRGNHYYAAKDNRATKLGVYRID